MIIRKNFTILFVLVFLFSIGIGVNSSFAQCTPDLSITSAGIYPDSATNLLPGIVGMPYNQVLQFKAPVDTQIIVGGFPVTANITNIELTSLSGLPPGLNSACNPANCKYPGGSNGCALISGTPTTAGLYNIVGVTTTRFTVFGTPSSQIDTVDYYFIDVTNAIGIDEVKANAELILDQNYPNPVTDHTQINYYSSKDRLLTLEVHDLLGSLVFSNEIEAQMGQNIFTLNLSAVTSGIYVYSVGNDEVKATKRMVIAKD